MKRMLCILLTLCMTACSIAVSVPAGAQAPEPLYEEHLTITATSLDIEEGYDFHQDPLMRFFEEKFNVTIELIPMSWANYIDRNRIWISSGDMPDMTFWDFNYSDYASYVEQGLIAKMPADLNDRYPHLAEALRLTQIADYCAEKMDGELYMIPKVTFYEMPADVITNHLSVYYRKDWAKALGYDFDMSISRAELDQFIADCKQMDPGGNGAGNTLGMVSETSKLLPVYLSSVYPYYDVFFNDGEAYVWGPAQEGTLEALKRFKAAYDAGTFYKDFFTASAPSDYQHLFNAGLSGAMLYDAAFGRVWNVSKEFAKASGRKAEECIGLAVLTDDEGVYHGKEVTNFWSATLFNPDISAEKLDRILAIMDYTCRPEVQDLINLGFEGTDYVVRADGTKEITREQDAEGNYVALVDKYKSFFYWAWLAILWDNYDQNNPSIPSWSTDLVAEAYQLKAQGTDIARIDFALQTFSGPYYDKAKSLDLSAELCELILMDGDIESNWKKWVDSKMSIINPTLEELNGALLGK